MTASERPQLFLHVGCRKSGTSSLQQALRDSTEQLGEQGLRFWLVNRKTHARRLLRPLRDVLAGGDREVALAQLRGLADRMVADPHPRHLLTIEDLAEQPDEAVALVHEAFAELDLHIVITARHWGRTLPSEWQQCLKERLTAPLEAFVEGVQQETPEAQALFLDRQDVPVIARRWQRDLPADRVVVIPVADSASRSTLMADFCALVGVDPEVLVSGTVPLNPSLGAAQAEMLRRFNVALGEDLDDHLRGGYWRVVRKGMVQQSLRLQPPRGRVVIPEEYAAWCHRATAERMEQVRASGFRLLGDPADLVAPASVAEAYRPPTEEEVAAVAVRTLAETAALRWSQMQEEDRAKRRRRRSSAHDETRTVLGKVRRRLGR